MTDAEPGHRTYRVADHPGRRRRARGRRRGAPRSLDAAGRRVSGSTIDWQEVAGRRRRDRRVRRRRSADEDVAVCATADAILLGAVGGPRWDDPSAASARSRRCSPCAAGSGCTRTCAPSRVHPAIARTASPLQAELLAGVDLLIVRELTGGLYFGERTEASGADRRAPRRSRHAALHEPEIGASSRLAFELARTAARGRLTSVDKANVLATSRLWRTVVDEVRRGATRTSSVTHQLVDSCAMLLVTPSRRSSTSSSRRTCSATSCRTRRPSSPARSACCPRRRSASAGRAMARSGCTSRSTDRRRTSPARTGRTRSARSVSTRHAPALVARSRGRRVGHRGGRQRRPRRRLADRRPGRSRAIATTASCVVGTTALRDRGRRPARRPRSGAMTAASAGRPLRHDPARRDAGREHHAVARRQAADRADARRVRHAVHRGWLAGVEPEGHRVLRGRPDDALGDRPARGVRLDPPSRQRARG